MNRITEDTRDKINKVTELNTADRNLTSILSRLKLLCRDIQHELDQ